MLREEIEARFGSLEVAARVAGYEQEVELELRRRGHAAPGEGQRDGGMMVTPWVITRLGWEASADDLDRSVEASADLIEYELNRSKLLETKLALVTQ